MAQLLLRGIPDEVVEALKERARDHRRSLQKEIHSILAFAASEPAPEDVAARIAGLRARLGKRRFDDSALLIRRDRDR